MVKGNAAALFHPVREHGVSRRCKDGHSSQHQILAEGHLKICSRFVPAISQTDVRRDTVSRRANGFDRAPSPATPPTTRIPGHYPDGTRTSDGDGFTNARP